MSRRQMQSIEKYLKIFFCSKNINSEFLEGHLLPKRTLLVVHKDNNHQTRGYYHQLLWYYQHQWFPHLHQCNWDMLSQNMYQIPVEDSEQSCYMCCNNCFVSPMVQ